MIYQHEPTLANGDKIGSRNHSDNVILLFIAKYKAHIKNLIVRLALSGLISSRFASWLIQRGGMRDA